MRVYANTNICNPRWINTPSFSDSLFTISASATNLIYNNHTSLSPIDSI